MSCPVDIVPPFSLPSYTCILSHEPTTMPLLTNYTPSDIIFGGLVQLLTLPYHRFFTYNTLRPAQEIQRHAARGGVQRTSPDREALHSVLVGWRSRKKDELNFAALAVWHQPITAQQP